MLSPRSKRQPDDAESERLAWAVLASSHAIPGGRNCLVRAVALERMLRRRGFDARLGIGARGRGRDFAAHAWVESDGRVLIGAEEMDTYEPLTKLSD